MMTSSIVTNSRLLWANWNLVIIDQAYLAHFVEEALSSPCIRDLTIIVHWLEICLLLVLVHMIVRADYKVVLVLFTQVDDIVGIRLGSVVMVAHLRLIVGLTQWRMLGCSDGLGWHAAAWYIDGIYSRSTNDVRVWVLNTVIAWLLAVLFVIEGNWPHYSWASSCFVSANWAFVLWNINKGIRVLNICSELVLLIILLLCFSTFVKTSWG